MGIEYSHSENRCSLVGAQTALPILFAEEKPRSLLDVGAGTGTWLAAALEYGVAYVAVSTSNPGKLIIQLVGGLVGRWNVECNHRSEVLAQG